MTSQAARAKLFEAFAPDIRPYLTYSFVLHLALCVAVWQGATWSGAKAKSTVYSIDFVGGPAAVIQSAAPSATPNAEKAPIAAAPERRAEPQSDFDEFGRRKAGKRSALPKPSLLRGWQAPKVEQPSAASAAPAAASAAAAESAGSGGEGGVEASAEMANFPYPWYITRVRQMLWMQWQSRMPKEAGECGVVFSLMPNGSVVDLRTESSSGDRAFDLAALGAVQDAAPYPPLPPAFKEPFLKVHVTLRSQ